MNPRLRAMALAGMSTLFVVILLSVARIQLTSVSALAQETTPPATEEPTVEASPIVTATLEPTVTLPVEPTAIPPEITVTTTVEPGETPTVTATSTTTATEEATPTPIQEQPSPTATPLPATPTPTAALAVTTTPVAGSATETRGMARTITVVGEGTARIRPDIAQATIGVEIASSSLQEATTEAEERMESVLDALQSAGVAATDMQTSGYNIWVERDFGPEGMATEEQIRYRVTNNVLVTIRDLENLATILGAAIDAGANNLYGVTFNLENPGEARSMARSEAVQDARENAEELAGLTNTQIGRVIHVSEIVEQPVDVFSSVQAAPVAEAGGAGPISPGELQVTERLQITYELQ